MRTPSLACYRQGNVGIAPKSSQVEQPTTRQTQSQNVEGRRSISPGASFACRRAGRKRGPGRVLPLSAPLRAVLERRLRRRQPGDSRVFRRDGVPVRRWRTALRDACRQAHVPHRMLHDCRGTAARNLIRAGVPERLAMLLTGHKTRAVFDRYNIVNEQELLTAGERWAA